MFIRRFTNLIATGLLLAVAVPSAIAQQTAPDDIRPLVLGQSVERELKGDESHSYSLGLQAGQFLDLVIEQKGIDVEVRLLDSNGKELIKVDSPNGMQGPEPVSLIIETTGTHRLEVRSLEKSAPAGRYEGKILALRTATEKDKSMNAAQKAFADGEALKAQRSAPSSRAAIKKYEEALPFYRFAGDKRGEAVTLHNIGAVYTALDEPQQALKFFTESLPLTRAVGDKFGEAATLNNISRLYDNLGERHQALKFYTQSLPLFREVGSKEGEAATLNNIGLAYFNLGEQQQALKFYNESLPLSRAMGNKSGEGFTLNNIGAAYFALGEREQALKFYSESLTLRRALGDKHGEAVTLNNIGNIHSDLGARQVARQFYTDALPLLRSVGDKRGEAITLHNLFRVWTLENPRLAAFHGKQSVNRYQAMRSGVRGLDKNVQRTFLKSIEDIYRKLANELIKEQRLAEAQQILNLFKDQQYFDLTSNKPAASAALTSRETAISADFDRKLELIVSAIQGADAFKRGIGIRPPTSDETKQIEALANALQSAKEGLQVFLNAAAEQFAASADSTDKAPEIADVIELQNALKETSAATQKNVVAVYTLISEKNYRALVVTTDNIFSVEASVKAVALNKKALQLWSLLRSPKYDPQPAANELYKIVFAPIEAKLPRGTKTILWSLDGNLRYIPMAALHDGKRYLAERYENVIFTRADKERMTRAVSPALAGTGLGSSEAHTVDLSGEKFNAAALPSVKDELDRIFMDKDSGGILAGGVLLDSRFTRAAMLSELKVRRPLVHIASHFKFQPGDEARSFLLLGDGTPFTLDEMKQQPELFSGVDLLTLSACETAAQKPDANGREVDGFAELAQRLGAGAVMASLWEVSDNSTAELMTRFYKTYRGPKTTTKSDALRRAQLALLTGTYNTAPTGTERQLERQLERERSDTVKSDTAKLKLDRPNRRAPFAHPFYWSPFILIGNWK